MKGESDIESRNTQEQSGRRYSARIIFRLSLEEYEQITRLSEEMNCSNSEVIRKLLFEKGINKSKISEIKEKENNKNKIISSITNTRSDFKTMMVSYKEIVDMTKDFIAEGRASGDGLARELKSLEDVTLQLQKSLNSVLHALGQNETHTVSRTASVKGANVEKVAVGMSREDYERYKILYCYMEKIQIMGNLAEDAAEYVREGKKRMSFKVIVERRYEKEKEKVAYTVFAPKGPIFDYLKKGTWVFVTGTFSEDRKTREKVVFPDEIRLSGNVQ